MDTTLLTTSKQEYNYYEYLRRLSGKRRVQKSSRLVSHLRLEPAPHHKRIDVVVTPGLGGRPPPEGRLLVRRLPRPHRALLGVAPQVVYLKGEL
jgi:hypothetical protein